MTYLSAGPVVATPTKPGRAGTGVEYAALAARARRRARCSSPAGSTPSASRASSAHGVRHFVVVRALTEAADPEAAARALADAIRDALGATAPST